LADRVKLSKEAENVLKKIKKDSKLLQLEPMEETVQAPHMTLAKAETQEDFAQVQMLVINGQLCEICMDDVPEDDGLCQDCLCRVEKARETVEKNGTFEDLVAADHDLKIVAKKDLN
jgi:hypothetical protein